jgi:hypothetical protein
MISQKNTRSAKPAVVQISNKSTDGQSTRDGH